MEPQIDQKWINVEPQTGSKAKVTKEPLAELPVALEWMEDHEQCERCEAFDDNAYMWFDTSNDQVYCLKCAGLVTRPSEDCPCGCCDCAFLVEVMSFACQI